MRSATATPFRKAVEEELNIEPALTTTDKQNQLVDTVLSGDYTYIAMGGGIRGTKTFGMLIVLIILCKMFPGSRWAIVRSDLPTLRRNVVPSMNKLREAHGLKNEMGPLRQDIWSYKFFNGSEILLFPESFNIDPDLERWKGLEVNGFLLEEASELQEASANKAIERAGSWIIPKSEHNPDPVQPPPFVFFTFNPTPNWPKNWFWDPFKAGTLRAPYIFIPATEKDNPFIPEAVREAWKNLPPEEYKRFILGEWDFLEDPDQLIKAEWVFRARNILPEPGPIRLGVDVGRFGDDPTAIAKVVGNALIKTETHPKLSIDRTVDVVAIRMMERPFPENARVDGVGLGAGVVDGLIRKQFEVIDVIAGAKPIERKDSFFKFKDLRSQMWWEFREGLRVGMYSFPDDISDTLIADLTTIRYTISADKVISVEPKDQLKKRLGRSSDEGDAVIQAYFDFPPPPKAPVLPETHTYSGW